MSAYRVHIHDQNDNGRWLTSVEFPAKRPTSEQIEKLAPLTEPGRYEVRVTKVSGSDEIGCFGWVHGTPGVDWAGHRYDDIGRRLVDCDEGCEARERPYQGNLAEQTAAAVHWQKHSYLGGCSHSR